MKARFQNHRNHALTMVELLVVIVVVGVLMALILPAVVAPHGGSQHINCVSNLKQINLGFRIWEGDNDGKYPMAVSVTNGGTLGLADGNNVFINFIVMSNELSTPKILVCPADVDRLPATNFWRGFDNSHVSYFVNLSADETYPQMLMTGDRNWAVGGVPAPTGPLMLPARAPITWTAALHQNVGNIGFADGSVAEVSDTGLQDALVMSTNGVPFPSQRFAIP